MRCIGAWVLGLVLCGMMASLADAKAPRLFGEAAVAKRAPAGATPVRLQEADVLRAAAGRMLDIGLPGEAPVFAAYRRHRELPEGRLLWWGEASSPQGRRPVVLVFGADGGFGVVPDAAGRLWAVKSHASGESWREPLNPVRPPPVCPPAGCSPAPASDAVTVAATKRTAAVSMSDGEARRAGGHGTRIDVLGIYTDDVVGLYGSDEAARTYYLSLIALANQALADSGVDAHYEVVAMARSSHDSQMSVFGTFLALVDNQLSDGLDVRALREQHGADLVAMLRDGAAHREIGGVGQMTGLPSFLSIDYGYSVSAFGGYVMAHELGHNLGSHHDRETETDANGVVRHGAYPYGHGYRESGDVPFHTIMAYRLLGQQEMPYFSGPEVWRCAGRPCGVQDLADNVRSLRLMAPRIARLREPAGELVVSDAEVLEPDMGRTGTWFSVWLQTPAPAGGHPVRVWTEPGTATPDVDFESLAPTTHVIPEGQRELDLPVRIIADSRVEPTETYRIVAESLLSGARAQGEGRIDNDDPRVRLAGKVRFEGAAPPTARFPLVLDDVAWRRDGESLLVEPPDFAFDIGVVAGESYDLSIPLRIEGTAFGPVQRRVHVGNTNQTIDYVVRPAQAIEGRLAFEGGAAPAEPIYVVAWGFNGFPNSGSGHFLQPPEFRFSIPVAPGTRFRIEPRDVPAPFVPRDWVFDDVAQAAGEQVLVLGTRPTLRVDDIEVDEKGQGGTGNVYVPVLLSGDASTAPEGGWGDIPFRWRRTGGTAQPGVDFQAAEEGEGILHNGQFASGFNVLLVDDALAEGTETIEFEIFDVAGFELADARAVVRIRDDDTPVPPALGLLDATAFEGDAGTRPLTFTARLDRPATAPVRFDIATRAGTATAGADFSATTLRGLQIDAGQVEARFAIPVLGDAVAEPGEHFFVELSNVSGASVAWPVARGRIQDDDGLLPGLDAPPSGWLHVDSDAGHQALSLSNLPALPDARFLASALVKPQRARTAAVSPDGLLSWLDLAATVEDTEYIVYASAEAAAGSTLRLQVGPDTGDPEPQEPSATCARGSNEGVARCEFRLVRPAGSPATRYWMRVFNDGAPTEVATTFAVVPLAGDARFITTGPGQLPAGSPFDVRLAWDDPRWLPGESRLGYIVVEARAGERVYFEPVRFERSGSVDAARVLLPGVPQALSLAPGATHSRVMLTLPPYATGLRVASQAAEGSGGNVRLEAVHLATPDGPAIVPAPAGAPLAVSTGQGLAQTLQLSSATLAGREGRWYIRVVNTGNQRVDLSLLAEPTMGANAAPVKPGSYFNPQRGGHGLFLYPAGDQWAGLWYTYLEDRTPTWYYMQAAAPGADGLWHGKVYRAAWNGQGNHLTEIGDMLVTPGRDGGFSLAVRMDGYSSEQTMAPFLTGCPSLGGAPLDASAHWFEPALSGYGYSVQVHPNYEFVAAFIYDELGRPRFLSAERGGAFDANAGTLPLYQLRGFGPLAPYQAPDRVEVGTLQRRYDGSGLLEVGVESRYAGSLPGGWQRQAPVQVLSGRQGCQ